MHQNLSERSSLFSVRSPWSILAFIIICIFGYLQSRYHIIPGFIEIWNIKNNPLPFSEILRLMWIPIQTYVIISSGIALFLNIFFRLKDSIAENILLKMPYGFTEMPIIGLFYSPAPGFIEDSIVSFFKGLILGTILGLLFETKSGPLFSILMGISLCLFLGIFLNSIDAFLKIYLQKKNNRQKPISL